MKCNRLRYSFSFLLFILCVMLVCGKFKNTQGADEYLKFIHIPKTAGTTIENISKKNGIKWGKFDNENLNPKGSYSCSSFWHDPNRYVSKKSRDETFCVIRDPVQRLISEYKYMYPYDKQKLNKEDYFTATKLNAWISYVVEKKLYITGGNDCHLIPQTNYVYDVDGKRSCDNLLRFEYLNDDFNKLMKTKNLAHLELNEIHNKSSTHLQPELTHNDITPENMEKIKEIYHKDFALLETMNN